MPPDLNPARVKVVIVAHSTYDHWDQLTHLDEAAGDLALALSHDGSSYDLSLSDLLKGGTRRQVEDSLGSWLQALNPKDRLLLYWAGHGTSDSGHYLVTKESPRHQLTPLQAFKAEVLGEIVAKCRAEKILLMIDTCYSSDGARQIGEIVGRIVSAQTALPGQNRFIGVIPSAHSLDKAKEATYCRKLVEVLAGEGKGFRSWEDGDQWIRAGDLRDSLIGAIAHEMGETWQPPLPVFTGIGEQFLPNPRFRRRGATDVETARQGLRVPDALVFAGRGIEVQEGGWYFTGRTTVLVELVEWLRNRSAGLAVLTGDPGSGKSAILGHLVMLSHAVFRTEAKDAGAGFDFSDSTVPPLDSIDVAVHAKGKNLFQCAQQIAEPLGILLPAETEQLFFDERLLIDSIKNHKRNPLVIILDALDESRDPIGIATFLRGLAHEGGVKVLVGSRRSPDGRVASEKEDRHARLRSIFGHDVFLIDLDDAPATTEDISRYVRSRLSNSRHHNRPNEIASVANRIAHQAHGIFLYARIVVRTLQDAEQLDAPLPDSPLDALATDLRERFGQDAPRVNGLLAGLAWVEGEGVSRRAWPYLATAASESDSVYSAEDVTWVLNKAGWHILQTQEADQTVYRLIHQVFAEHYRKQVDNPRRIHRRLIEQFTETISGVGWIDADGYLARHLATHAVYASELGKLVRDVGYMAVADPSRLLPLLGTLRDPESRNVASVYRRAAHLLMYEANTVERMAILHLTAVRESSRTASFFTPLLTPRWRARWGHFRTSIPFTNVPIISANASLAAIAFSTDVGTTLVMASGEELRSVVLDRLMELPKKKLHGSITAIAIFDGLEESFICAGTEYGNIYLVRLRTMELAFERQMARSSLIRSLTVLPGDKPLLASGCEDGSVGLWSLPGLDLVKSEFVAAKIVATAEATLDNLPVLVVVGDISEVKRMGRQDNSVSPGITLSVPDLEKISVFGDEEIIDKVEIADVDGEPIVLATHYSYLRAYELRTGQQVPIPTTDDDIRATSFMTRESGSKTRVTLNAYGVYRDLFIHRSGEGFKMSVTPWVETGFGMWLGPALLWNTQYLISVCGEDIKLWDVDDLDSAISNAPSTSEEMRRVQRDAGLMRVVGVGNEVWASTDSGKLLEWSAADGERCRYIHGSKEISEQCKPVALTSLTLGREAVLIAGYSEGWIRIIHVNDHGRDTEINVHGKLFSVAVSPTDEGALLAAATHTQLDSERGSYQVRLWNLPSCREVSTRDPLLQARWMLEFTGWSDKPLSSVAFAHSSKGLLVLAGGYNQIVAWNVEDLKPIAFFTLPEWGHDHVTSLAVGNGVVAAVTYRGYFIGWDINTREIVWQHQGAHRGFLRVLAIRSGPTEMYATGGEDSIVRIWSAEGKLELSIEIGDAILHAVQDIAQLQDGGLAIATLRGLVVLDIYNGTISKFPFL